MEIALKYKVKQSKNGKFSSNYQANPIDFETHANFEYKPLSKNKPLKKGI